METVLTLDTTTLASSLFSSMYASMFSWTDRLGEAVPMMCWGAVGYLLMRLAWVLISWARDQYQQYRRMRYQAFLWEKAVDTFSGLFITMTVSGIFYGVDQIVPMGQQVLDAMITYQENLPGKPVIPVETIQNLQQVWPHLQPVIEAVKEYFPKPTQVAQPEINPYVNGPSMAEMNEMMAHANQGYMPPMYPPSMPSSSMSQMSSHTAMAPPTMSGGPNPPEPKLYPYEMPEKMYLPKMSEGEQVPLTFDPVPPLSYQAQHPVQYPSVNPSLNPSSQTDMQWEYLANPGKPVMEDLQMKMIKKENCHSPIMLSSEEESAGTESDHESTASSVYYLEEENAQEPLQQNFVDPDLEVPIENLL